MNASGMPSLGYPIFLSLIIYSMLPHRHADLNTQLNDCRCSSTTDKCLFYPKDKHSVRLAQVEAVGMHVRLGQASWAAAKANRVPTVVQMET